MVETRDEEGGVGNLWKRLGYGLAGLLVVYGLLIVASRLLAGPIEQVAFFDERPGERRPLVLAHQGGLGRAPSNTMIAFTRAVEIGADILDSDVHETSDGELVLLHDETVDRTSDGRGAVRDLTLADLRALDFGYRFTLDDGRTHPYRGKGHGIVTVEELFDAFPRSRFGLEIKQTTAGAADRLCRLIQRFDYEERVMVSSFEQGNLDVFRAACPKVATSATMNEVRNFYIFQRLGLVGLYPIGFDALQVPERAAGVDLLTSGFVANAHRRGVKVLPWTINDEDDFRRLIDEFDVDGINTDHPDRLVAVIDGDGP